MACQRHNNNRNDQPIVSIVQCKLELNPFFRRHFIKLPPYQENANGEEDAIFKYVMKPFVHSGYKLRSNHNPSIQSFKHSHKHKPYQFSSILSIKRTSPKKTAHKATMGVC